MYAWGDILVTYLMSEAVIVDSTTTLTCRPRRPRCTGNIWAFVVVFIVIPAYSTCQIVEYVESEMASEGRLYAANSATDQARQHNGNVDISTRNVYNTLKYTFVQISSSNQDHHITGQWQLWTRTASNTDVQTVDAWPDQSPTSSDTNITREHDGSVTRSLQRKWKCFLPGLVFP